MKAAFVASLFGAVSMVVATPTPTDPEPPTKRATIPTVVVSGNAFWADGKRFFVRGIDYQPGGSSKNLDPMADPEICMRDLEYFKKLGINSVRIYSTDNSKDHKECMDAYAAAGIYLLLDINNPKYSINREDPEPSYNAVYLQSVFASIDEFSKYDNTMAFFSANEVVHGEHNTSLAARYVKATTRDMKSYMVKRGMRHIPVGYSAADVSENRMQQAHYFNCGSDDERSDFFAFNDYSWCSSDFKTAGWDAKVKNFTGYGVPIFLSEYGCNENTRDFGEVKALMSSDMTAVYSGGLMYEFTEEESKYGIAEVKDGKVSEMQPEFDNFAKALADNPAPTDSAGASSTQAKSECPPQDDWWYIDTELLPAMPDGAKKYFDDGAGTGPGLNGPGSQTAGERNLPNATAGSGFGGDSTNDGSGGSNQNAAAVQGLSLSLTSSALVVSVLASLLL